MKYELQSGKIKYSIGENGMLKSIILPDTFHHADLLACDMNLTVTLENGTKLFAAGNKNAESWTTRKGVSILEFSDLVLADSGGNTLPGFRLTLRYEFYDDGTVFTDAFFLGEMQQKDAIAGFELTVPLNFTAFDTVRWSVTYRPKKTDGALIQTSAPERNLMPGEDHVFEQSIFPLAGFNLWKKDGPSCYAEFLMEGDNVLTGDPSCNRSSITWKNGNPVLSWNFQTKADRPASGPWQWRNRWGWVIAPATQNRHFPPLPMYHFFDNFIRYPSDETLKSIADAGVAVLILHENWRTDVQNGGQPYDPVRFREVIDFAHKHNIRVMVYIRGNEDSIIEELGDWFDYYLKRDYDGLYMDYGGPFHNQTPPDESVQGGRIHFRKHYLENRTRREIVGKNGLLYSHTGPMFSALGMTGGIVDGYVSGEGERGLLIRSRLDHAYFSMAAVCPGTMWTAAFPEYSSPVMIPYLAAAGQTPHVPLGVQFPSSSLAHPPVPGLGDIHFRPLWKLWNLMQGTTDLRVLNDYNVSGIFERSQDISHYLMIAKDKAVCIYANMTGETIRVNGEINLEKAGIPTAWKKFLCLPDKDTPGKAVPFNHETFELAPYGIGAVIFRETDFTEYEKPYAQLSSAGKDYLRYVEEQQHYRREMPPAEEWFLRVKVQDLPVPYEESMIVDLYDNRFELNEVVHGEYRMLGYISKKGFQTGAPQKEDFVMNGEISCWIPLRKILGPGRHDLAIRSLHRGDLYYVNTPFYSFLEVELAKEPGEPSYCIRFLNELEKDRSYLHFSVKFSGNSTFQ